jgi:CheY-like chemotaxis protein
MLTVPAGEQHLEECLVSGINDFLVAPFPEDELVYKVRRLTTVPRRREATGLVSIRGGRLDGKAVVGKLLNLSAGGLLVEAESFLAVGRIVDVVFFLADGGPPVGCRARVVRRAAELALFHPAYGLEFDELSAGERVRVDAWVDAHPEEGVIP